MNIGLNGFNDNTVTFEATEEVSKGTLVKLIDDNTVAPCENGDKVVGVCVNERQGYAAVKLCGYVELPVSGAVNVGFQTLSAADGNTLKADTDGREYLVVSADTDVIGLIL